MHGSYTQSLDNSLQHGHTVAKGKSHPEICKSMPLRIQPQLQPPIQPPSLKQRKPNTLPTRSHCTAPDPHTGGLCVECEHLWVQWSVLVVTIGVLAHLSRQECTASERCVG